jgi:hypothetical protein
MKTYPTTAIKRHFRAITALTALALPVAACGRVEPASEGNVAQAEQALTTCITIQRGNGAASDARLSKNAKNTNFGGNPVLQVGEDDHSLLRFDLSAIPSTAVVDSATLKLYSHSQSDGDDDDDDDDGEGQIRIHRANASWTESGVTYKNYNNQYDSAVAGVLVGHYHTALQSANVKGLVAQWVSGAKPNHGFLLENKDGDDKTIFAASETSNAALRPALEVCYTTPDVNGCDTNPCAHGACTNTSTGYSCACDPGWTGTNCDGNINECAGNPCVNGGTCTDGTNSYTCACPAGYTGTNCEIDIDECAANPCVNGDCTDLVNAYQCTCNPGFSGTNCETNIDDCAGAPCLNGSTCTDQVNGYTCACPAGYTGTNCEIDIDECAANPCQNGMCIDGINAYACVCDPGFSGTNCETNVDECAGAPCLNGGSCSDGIFSYTCSCAAGYTGTNCEVDVNDCVNSACQNGGTCVDGVNSYSCQCAAGWTGANCETNIDECANSPCQNGGTCVDGINSYSCQCAGGWSGANCNQGQWRYSCTTNNPCTVENAANGQFYFPAMAGDQYFIQCTSNQQCYQLSCGGGRYWNPSTMSCETTVPPTTCPCSGQSWWQFQNREACTGFGPLDGSTFGTRTYVTTSQQMLFTAFWGDLVGRCGNEPYVIGGSFLGEITGLTPGEVQACAAQLEAACTCTHGTYNPLNGSCTCDEGWSGTNCDIVVGNCASNPCAHGVCTDGNNTYTCTCDPGWTGTNCDQSNLPHCPCEQFSDWLNFSTLNLCQVYASSGQTNLYTNAGMFGVVADTCISGNSGSASGLTPAEAQVCRDQLMAANVAHGDLCASCDGMNCGTGACYSDGSTAYCYY